MIYLDNAATSFPKPPEVLAAIESCLMTTGANPGRGQHKMSLAAGRLILNARTVLARLFGVANPSDIIFTANATEALNLAIKGWVRPGDTVVTTSIEHNSVNRPLEYLAENHKVKVIRIVNASNGELDLAKLSKLVNKTIRLVVVTHASNVIGNILPVADIAAITKKAKVPLLVDASQTAGCVPISVEETGIDMLAFTGHKALLGPQGVGGLYINKALEIKEMKQGGTGSMSKEKQPMFRPDRYESGTPNTPGLAGLSAAAKFILESKVEKIFREEQEKMARLMMGLGKIKGISIYGPAIGTSRVGLVSIQMNDIGVHQLAFLLDKRFDIAARAGFHCAPEAHRTLGTYKVGTLRLSPGYFSTDEDIDATIEALAMIARDLT